MKKKSGTPHWYHFGSIDRALKEMSKKSRASGCWNWLRSKQTGGYGQISYKGRRLLAHRLSYEIFLGPIPAGKMVCHKCNNPACINPKHFFLGEAKNSHADSVEKGRAANRVPDWAVKKNRCRKLSDSAVLEIRASKDPLALLAERYGTSAANVSMIRNGRRKKLVEPPPVAI